MDNKNLHFSDFRNIYQDKPIIVCGCGPSLNDLKNPEQLITIGVNDVGRLFTPTYLVVLNHLSQFSEERRKYIKESQAEAIFTQLDLKINHPNIVRFKLGKRGGTDFSDPEVLNYTQNSPYVALCLAVYMGAKKIGLIGVDFTDNHFWGQTGRHNLTHKLQQIDGEYSKLAQSIKMKGIEIINLSRQSRLTGLAKGTIKDLTNYSVLKSASIKIEQPSPKIFFVCYRFLSCGDVFKIGLTNAAEDLGVKWAEAYWDDPYLPAKVREFGPDLIFVLHGRKFAKKWGKEFDNYNTAVWLLDEPYEVDDTARFSGLFDTVYVNDPSTIGRHKNAYYLPVCYDPHIYYENKEKKEFDVGFIGGYNRRREILLESLIEKDLLSYVVGGPWRSNLLKKKCLSQNISPLEVAELYKKTKIIVNIFREKHHFNCQNIKAYSLNPRIYEALACGALVVSEERPEINQTFQDLPVFNFQEEISAIIKKLLDNREYNKVRSLCIPELVKHTYADRLKKIIQICLGNNRNVNDYKARYHISKTREKIMTMNDPLPKYLKKWEKYGNIDISANRLTLFLKKMMDTRPGSEQGLVSRYSYGHVNLSLDLKAKENTFFIAKIHQQDKLDQTTNSYHFIFYGETCYLAKHNYVFKKLYFKNNIWEKISLSYEDGLISFKRNNHLIFQTGDTLLKSGYAFLGMKGGEVQLRNISIENGIRNMPDLNLKDSDYDILYSPKANLQPQVSIITTVYDRVECLRNCIKSVINQSFKNYEHIIIADSPSAKIINEINSLVNKEDYNRITFVNLKKRYNNWGITPATAGINMAKGKYLCFLSDDNGYTQDHITNLVDVLQRNSHLGFVYSSCRYDGRLVLNSSIPQPGRIDLGQPLFRRELFEIFLKNTLPFNEIAWDWRLIEAFIEHGIKYKHVNQPSFIFRLDKYPELLSGKKVL